MKVSEIMTRDVEIVAPDDTIRSAARMMADSGIGALPVGEHDRLVGMVTDRDIVVRCVAAGAPPDSCKVRDAMSPKIDYVFDDEDVSAVADKMAKAQVRRLPVLNRDKRLVGIASLGDMAFAGEKDKLGHAFAGIAQPTGKHEQTEMAFAGDKPDEKGRK